jgi:hypothetical protein
MMNTGLSGASRQSGISQGGGYSCFWPAIARTSSTLLFLGSFFHGVNGPDFVVDENGEAYFTDPIHRSHVGIFDPRAKVKVSEEEAAMVAHTRPYTGPRRMNLIPGIA